MKSETAPFDAADYLDDDETIAEYLTAALEDPNPDMFLVAVKTMVRARTHSACLPRTPNLGARAFTRPDCPSQGYNHRYQPVVV